MFENLLGQNFSKVFQTFLTEISIIFFLLKCTRPAFLEAMAHVKGLLRRHYFGSCAL